MNAPFDILVSRQGRAVWTAAVAGGTLTDVTVEKWSEDPPPASGDIYAARVARVNADRRLAFLDLGGWPGFLSLRRDERGRWPAEGSLAIVQVTAEAAADKETEATLRPVLTGRYVVFSPLVPGLHFSRRIEPAAQAPLAQEIRPLARPDEGLIVRRTAVFAPPGAIAAEIASLRERWRDLSAGAPDRPGALRREPVAAVRLARDLGPGSVARIAVDNGALLAQLRGALRAAAPDCEGKLTLQAGTDKLFDAAAIADAIGDALSRRLALANGAELIFDEAEAATAIDVNAAKASGAPLAVDLHAAAEVARQIRLRNLSGLIVVDFLRLDGREERERVVDALRQALRDDPVAAEVLGFTRGGLVEITRRRLRPSLQTALAAIENSP